MRRTARLRLLSRHLSTEDAKAFAEASRRLDSEVEWASIPDSYQSIVNSTRPDVCYQNLKEHAPGTVDQCLITRGGNSKFRLTRDQKHHLEKLKSGTEKRRTYLYSLATNPAVLQEQKT